MYDVTPLVDVDVEDVGLKAGSVGHSRELICFPSKFFQTLPGDILTKARWVRLTLVLQKLITLVLLIVSTTRIVVLPMIPHRSNEKIPPPTLSTSSPP